MSEAKRFYSEFTKVSTAVARDGGQHPERLQPYLSDIVYQGDLVGAKSLQKLKYHASGKYVTRNFTTESVDLDAQQVEAYVCLDFSKAAFVDSAGKPVYQQSAEQRTVIVTLKALNGRFRIDRNKNWSGRTIC